ncbi:MAG TPA: hypothetical protein DD405_02060 [Desulfobacteraceae bacterium]|nr:hypothetical protein [Desulfobacteraceae bacterium]
MTDVNKTTDTQDSAVPITNVDPGSSGYAIKTPFRVSLNASGQIVELVCHKALRILPGKRLVCCGKWIDKKIVAKFFLDSNKAAKHCEREENGLSALRKAGIKTPDLLFKGTLHQGALPVLIFKKLDPADNLEILWKKAESHSQRIDLLKKIVRIIAVQHEAGIKQDDIHLANFMLFKDQIYTLDGSAVDFRNLGRPLPAAASLNNLALFLAQFYPEFDELIKKIFALYVSKRSIFFKQHDCERLIKKVSLYREYKKKSYLKKIFRECSAFACKKNHNSLTICDRQYQSELMDTFLADPDIFFKTCTFLKQGNTSTVALVKINGRQLVVKRYNVKSFLHSFRYLFRKSRASVSWKNAQRLFYILNIPTPKPVAFLEKRLGLFKKKSYFITEYIDGISAYNLFHSNEVEDIAGRKHLVCMFGRLLQSLSDALLSHGDFKASNFIISNDKVFLLDLDAMQEHSFRWMFRKKFRRDCLRLTQNLKELPQLAEMFKKALVKKT